MRNHGGKGRVVENRGQIIQRRQNILFAHEAWTYYAIRSSLKHHCDCVIHLHLFRIIQLLMTTGLLLCKK